MAPPDTDRSLSRRAVVSAAGRSPRRRLRAVLVAAAAATVLAPLSAVRRPVVNGHPVLLFGRADAAAALRAAHRAPVPGKLVAVDGTPTARRVWPAGLWVDGRPAGPSTLVGRFSVVTLTPAPDATEPGRKVSEQLPAPWAGPERVLMTPGVPGRVTALEGVISRRRTAPDMVVEPQPERPITDRPVVALTFDDGPGPRTAEILDVLASRQAPATFFVVGDMVRLHPDLLRRTASMGLTIGNHSRSHRPRFERLGESEVAEEIRACDELILATIGRRPELFRPPGGALQPGLLDAVKASGKRLIVWDVDPADYRNPPAQVIVARVMAQLRPGAVILLHDGGGSERNTAAALGPLIDSVRAAGYTIVSLV